MSCQKSNFALDPASLSRDQRLALRNDLFNICSGRGTLKEYMDRLIIRRRVRSEYPGSTGMYSVDDRRNLLFQRYGATKWVPAIATAEAIEAYRVLEEGGFTVEIEEIEE